MHIHFMTMCMVLNGGMTTRHTGHDYGRTIITNPNASLGLDGEIAQSNGIHASPRKWTVLARSSNTSHSGKENAGIAVRTRFLNQTITDNSSSQSSKASFVPVATSVYRVFCHLLIVYIDTTLPRHRLHHPSLYPWVKTMSLLICHSDQSGRRWTFLSLPSSLLDSGDVKKVEFDYEIGFNACLSGIVMF